MKCRSVILVGCLGCVVLEGGVPFPGVGVAAEPRPDEAISAKDAHGLDALLRLIVLHNVPHQYEDTKNWGGTKEVWDGLKVSWDGLLVKTKRRTREVNHGTWEQYRAWLIDPDRQLQIRLEHAGSVPGQGAGFGLLVECRLGAAARWSEWQRGIQLYSLSADAEARVRLSLRGTLGLSFDGAQFPPDLILQPVVADARLELVDVRLHRLSKLDGPLVKQAGRRMRDLLQEEVNRRTPRLVQRMNEEIQEHRDRLRFPLKDLTRMGLERFLGPLRQIGSYEAVSPPASLLGPNACEPLGDDPESLAGTGH